MRSSDLTVDGVALSAEFAADNNARDRRRAPAHVSGQRLATATVQAIYEGSELGVSGDFVISLESFDEHFLP